MNSNRTVCISGNSRQKNVPICSNRRKYKAIKSPAQYTIRRWTPIFDSQFLSRLLPNVLWISMKVFSEMLMLRIVKSIISCFNPRKANSYTFRKAIFSKGSAAWILCARKRKWREVSPTGLELLTLRSRYVTFVNGTRLFNVGVKLGVIDWCSDNQPKSDMTIQDASVNLTPTMDSVSMDVLLHLLRCWHCFNVLLYTSKSNNNNNNNKDDFCKGPLSHLKNIGLL